MFHFKNRYSDFGGELWFLECSVLDSGAIYLDQNSRPLSHCILASHVAAAKV